MFIAAQEGHSSVVELLLKADGVDVNKGRRMEYAFVYCRSFGHSSVVELLLKADGVDVNKAREDGWTPLSGPLKKVTRPWWSYC